MLAYPPPILKVAGAPAFCQKRRKRMLRTTLRMVRDRARVAVSALAPWSRAAALYRGRLPGQGETTSLLYLGAEAYARELAWLFSGGGGAAGAAQPERGGLPGAGGAREIGKMAASADVVVRQRRPGGRARPGELVFAPFLDGRLPLEASLEAQIGRVRSKAHRRRMRGAMRSGAHRWTVSEGGEAFDLFYDRMHAPYVRARFGPRSRLDDREALRALPGKILLVFESGTPVSGTLLVPDRAQRALLYHRNGFAGGETWPPAVMARRTAALEVAVLEYARREGFRSLDLGFTRAVLNDGLFVHKRRLGCSFAVASYSPTFLVSIRPEARTRVLSGLPLACLEGGGFAAHVGYDLREPLRAARKWRPVVKNYAFPGVRRVVVHTDAPGGDPGREAFAAALGAALRGVPFEFAAVDAAQSRLRQT